MIKKYLFNYWPLFLLLFLSVFFFWKFFFQGLIPIPADTIVGLYHPWRDVVWDNLTAGVPFKNFLITDPVRQQYPWRLLAINLFKQGQIPLWNPFTHAGQPLLANLQTAALYPLNFLFFLLPFNFTWGMMIFLQPLLAGVFTYLYLKEIKLKKVSALIGALTFSFSGFFMAWLEWGTILQVVLWLPLILLSVEKILFFDRISFNRQTFKWSGVFLIGMVFSFFGGHLQPSFYLIIFLIAYLVWRLFQVKRNRRQLTFFFFILFSLFLVLTAVQWWPTLKFISLSARGIDQINWQKPGWFIPWPHLVQFLAPDFFGNPTTLNYWGEWNYGEFIGFVGVIPLILSFLGVLASWRKKKFFFPIFGLLALSFALPTPWAKLPYLFNLPFLSTSQPTRLLFLVDFCLAILAAFGLDYLIDNLKGKKLKIDQFMILGIFGVLFSLVWVLVLLAPRIWSKSSWLINLSVSTRNLILPTVILICFSGLVFGYYLLNRFLKKKKILAIVLPLFLFSVFSLTVFDLFRFGWKFTPFVKEEWLFPSTKTIEFLKQDPDIFRIMSTDRRLIPPNFSTVYELQTINGYDPLYLRRYGELVAAIEREEPDISPPFGFNRIITPQNYQSKIIDLMNVKYVLSLNDLDSPKLNLVFQEGETRVYKNNQAFPRAFMAYDYQIAKDKQEIINLMMDTDFNLAKTVIFNKKPERTDFLFGENQVNIKDYQENSVLIEIETQKAGVLVLSDAFYPDWQAEINGLETEIYQVNYHFRGIIIPEGKHLVFFKYDGY